MGFFYVGGSVSGGVAWKNGTLTLINTFAPAGISTFTNVTIDGAMFRAPSGALMELNNATVNSPFDIVGTVTVAGSGTTTRLNGVVTKQPSSSLFVDSGILASSGLTLIVASGFTNNGTISLAGSSGNSDTLQITAGVLDNAGTLSFSGGTHAINGNVTNHGTINTFGTGTKGNFSGAFTNFSALAPGTGGEIVFKGGSYTHNGGSLSGSLVWEVLPVTLNAALASTGQVKFRGSTIGGPAIFNVQSGSIAELDNATVNAPITIAGSLRVIGKGGFTRLQGGFTGPVTGSIVILPDSDATAAVHLVTSTGFTNSGSISFSSDSPHKSVLQVVSGLLTNAGTIHASSGGHIIQASVLNQNTVSTAFSGSLEFMLLSGAVFTNAGSGTLTGFGSGSIQFSEGSYVHDGGSLSGHLVWSNAQVAANANLTSVDVAAFDITGTTIVGSGKLIVPVSTTVTFSDSVMFIPLEIEGTVKGSALIESSVLNSGVLAPGTDTAAGVISIDGVYIQLADGTLRISLGGTTPGTQFDRLLVTEAATLSGTLELSPLNNFLPQAGATFDVLTFGSISNGFATTATTGFPNGVTATSANVAAAVRVTFAVQLTTVHWLGGNGNFNDPTKWEGGAVPTANQNAVIDAEGTYVVTASGTIAVNSLEILASADASPTLRISNAEITTAVFVLNTGVIEAINQNTIHGQFNNDGLLRAERCAVA
jgi:hypothetical protein